MLALFTAALSGCAGPGAGTTRVLGHGAISAPAPARQHRQASAATAQEASQRAGTDTGTTAALSLDACVRIAMERSPVREAARLGVIIAGEDVGASHAPYYPELALTASWSRFQRRAYLPASLEQQAPSPVIGPTNDWLAGFVARYTLFDGGRRAAEARKALTLQRSAEAELQAAMQELAFEVRRSFYALTAANQVHAVAVENLARAEAHLQLAEQLREAGAVPGADVLRAEVEVAEARLALARAAGARRVARGQLSVVMGLPVISNYTTDMREPQIEAPDLPGPETLIAEALERRPELQAGRQRTAARNAAVDAARSARWPRLTAQAGYNLRDEHFAPEDEEWFATVNLNWTIFSGYSIRHDINRARAELSREEVGLQQLALQVQQEVWIAHAGVEETWETVHASRSQVISARESLRGMRARYEAGAATMTGLLDAQTALARAETNHAEAGWEHCTAVARLDRALGKAWPEE